MASGRLAVAVIALIGTTIACGTGGAGSSAPNTLHLQYVVRSVGCGAPQAVEDPDAPGHCVVLGNSLFGPSDFTTPVVKHDAVRGVGVGITLTSSARAVFVRDFDTIARSAPDDADARLTFVFDGQALEWTLLPGPDANLLVVTPNATVANRIVASLQDR
jgi:hypothetical protein